MDQSALGPCMDPEEHFMLGMKLLRMSLDTSSQKMIELNVRSREEIDSAIQSIKDAEQRSYQIFSVGIHYQWWATKD